MGQLDNLGKWGEACALAYLQKKGYRLRVKNQRHQREEIDLIMEDGMVWVAVEVKTRTEAMVADWNQMVSPAKRRAIIRVMDAYVLDADTDVEVRFDIVLVVKTQNGYTIEHRDDAFGAF
jgi:putative endonuclease